MTAQKGTQIVDRACLCQSLHLMTPFAQVYVAQIAQIQSVYNFPFRRSLWSGAWRHLGHIESKVGPKSGAIFLIICAGRKSLLFWRNFRFYGLCIFKWPGLYYYYKLTKCFLLAKLTLPTATHLFFPQECENRRGGRKNLCRNTSPRFPNWTVQKCRRTKDEKEGERGNNRRRRRGKTPSFLSPLKSSWGDIFPRKRTKKGLNAALFCWNWSEANPFDYRRQLDFFFTARTPLITWRNIRNKC